MVYKCNEDLCNKQLNVPASSSKWPLACYGIDVYEEPLTFLLTGIRSSQKEKEERGGKREEER